MGHGCVRRAARILAGGGCPIERSTARARSCGSRARGSTVASAETLDAFASGLGDMVAEEISPAFDTPLSTNALRLPVQGVVLRAAGEADLAGVARPGVLLATRPGALVTSPTAATVRYAGPLLDLGSVIILEPNANTLFVLAGLAQVYETAGRVIDAGAPVGTMGPIGIGGDQLLSPNGEGAGSDRTETLYIEVRENNRPVDPDRWFDLGPDA